MQRAARSNGPHSKSSEFQRETPPRAAGFELCLCAELHSLKGTAEFLKCVPFSRRWGGN